MKKARVLKYKTYIVQAISYTPGKVLNWKKIIALILMNVIGIYSNANNIHIMMFHVIKCAKNIQDSFKKDHNSRSIM